MSINEKARENLLGEISGGNVTERGIASIYNDPVLARDRVSALKSEGLVVKDSEGRLVLTKKGRSMLDSIRRPW